MKEQGTAFQRQAWELCRQIPKGWVSTYGELARAMGKPGAARAIGRAMACNPYAPEVPCHRVVASDGRLNGYSGAGGLGQKAQMLRVEGVEFAGDRVSLDRLWRFETAC